MSCDYLVVGAGAMGMAFTDVINNESDATVIMVDKRDRPGGHWNTAYPFVRLHQPSAFYGVNSRPLGRDLIDQHGWNEGLYELASHSEVCAYFDAVMREQFLPSGRVQFFGNHEYLGENKIRSIVTGEIIDIDAKAKTVDAAYMNVTVPSMTPPSFAVDDAVNFVPVNDLPTAAKPDKDYVVVGAGKTGMDACLWLLKNHVSPNNIRWIMPRDSWMLDRKNIQPGELAANTAAGFGRQIAAAAESTSVDDLFDRVSAAGQLLRLDDSVKPTMYRCATVTVQELDELRRINNVVRMGRVSNIASNKINLDSGDLAIDADTVVVDCSADGLERRPIVPVFNDRQVTLQAVRTCQQVFSAAFVAHVELSFDDEGEKNTICSVVPHPDNDIDFLRTTLSNTINGAVWSQYPELQQWLAEARLDGFSRPGGGNALEGLGNGAQEMAMKAAEKLQSYIAEAESKTS
jgi:hypothetical protein